MIAIAILAVAVVVLMVCVWLIEKTIQEIDRNRFKDTVLLMQELEELKKKLDEKV
ncbi:MAG: hypothetical protein HUK08_08085 [Bacteroidaceae bacterium]|nr:hypothetical protein [Bacteroidaceae bacterium]